jgi:glutamate formiminotransferase / formiminotetrahydrofolate cyclodeaminase
MTQPLIECIPNFSEARRPEVIASIASAITAVDGVRILDQHADLDHNRTVITFVGPPEAVAEAAFQAIAKAGELIDLNEHQGEHPRIGAADVVPFVPLSGISMEACVALAKQLGQRVGDELGIPVYLYEEAATRPERQNLENIRRGQYEGLKIAITADPDRAPDFGPTELGPAGAVVIGARHPLIAFNVYLTTDDVQIAKRIAKAVRHSSGGLRFVKGLGMLVDGRAQVSMNLTNFRATPLARVVEFIRREATRYGVAIHHTELVGLIPQDALVDAAVWYTQMDQFEPDQMLETRLYAASQTAPAAATTETFLDDLASSNPTPGGGSAAAYAGAMAASLVEMVARVTLGKKKYADVEPQMQAIIPAAARLRGELLAAVAEDSAAFEAVMAAFRLSKDTPTDQDVRVKAIDAATLNAARVPLDVMRRLVEVLHLAAQAAESGNLNAITDAGSGAELAQAALRAASLNVRVNLASLKDHTGTGSLWDDLQTLQDKAAILEARVRTALTDRGGAALA